MNHARVKAADLRFHLYERSVHPELFDILRRVEIGEAAYRAELVICGQSHVAAVRARGETITEVVAPGQTTLPRIGIRSTLQLGRDRRPGGANGGRHPMFDEVRRTEGAITYVASLAVETYAPAEYRQVTARLLGANRFERIKAFFDDALEGHPVPSPTAIDSLPFALIDFRHERAALEVTSLHACPHELTIVRVESRFEVREE